MFEIAFFRDARGKEPVLDWLEDLRKQSATSKQARVRLNKIHDYLAALAEHGTRLGLPFVRHMEGEIWELRPTSDRVFFFCHAGNTFILLHHFQKKTQTTPRREIEQAQRNRKIFLEKETT